MDDPPPTAAKNTQLGVSLNNVNAGGDVLVAGGNINVENLTPQERADRRDLKILLEKVETFWIKGVLEKSVYQQLLIELNKTPSPDAVEHPWQRVIETDQLSEAIPPKTATLDIFNRFNRKLLILGEPGSGKTTELLMLAKHLLAEAKQNANAPIPVVFNLSTWAKERKPLEEWMIDELRERYGIGTRKVVPLPFLRRRSQQDHMTGRWLENNWILPLLDGVDEVAPEYQRQCVEAINTFIDMHGTFSGILVCSRKLEYEKLNLPLKLDGAITLQALNDEQIKKFFEQTGESLHGLRTVWEQDEGFVELTRSPLMLNIMSFAYQDVSQDDFADVTFRGQDAQRGHLFDTYIEKMFKRKGQRETAYSQGRTKRWVSWLAKQMNQHQMTVFFIEDLQPDWLMKTPILAYWLICGLTGGLISGLTSWLIFGLMGWLTNRTNFESVLWVDNAVPALVVGVLFGFPAFFSVLGSRIIRPVEALRLSKNFRRGLRIGVQVGLRVGLIFSFIFALVILIVNISLGVSAYEWMDFIQILSFLIIVLIPGLIVGLIGGLFGGLIESKNLDTRRLPNQGIRVSLRNWLIFMLIFMLIFVLILLISGLIFGNLDSLLGSSQLYGLGIISAAILALFFGGRAVLQHTSLRILLFAYRHVPLNYARFLDYSSSLILLNKIGGGYRFIHRLLQDHFTQMEVK